MNPNSLRAKWGLGIDEADPNYSFIGVEGGSICWVENDDADAFRKVVEAHNAILDAWEAQVKKAEERAYTHQVVDATLDLRDKLKAAEATNAALRERLEVDQKAWSETWEKFTSRIVALEADNAALRERLLALTPGGSEFVGDPMRCLEFVEDRMATFMKVAAANAALRERLTDADGLLSKLPPKLIGLSQLPEWCFGMDGTLTSEGHGYMRGWNEAMNASYIALASQPPEETC